MQNNTIEISKSFFQKVYGWMFIGLIVSGLAAYFTATNSTINTYVLGNSWVMITLIIIELILVLVLAFLIKKLSPTIAGICFFLFALINGLTLSVIFLIYTTASIELAFFITAAMFGIMSLVGMFTKIDLSKIGPIMLMGLFGIIIASLINLFFNNPTVYYIISIISVVIFTGLTAYDTQRIKNMALSGIQNEQMISKLSISGALSLYLDFINLFLSLLRIFGKKR